MPFSELVVTPDLGPKLSYLSPSPSRIKLACRLVCYVRFLEILYYRHFSGLSENLFLFELVLILLIKMWNHYS